MDNKPKLLIFIVAYHAESTIIQVLTRIPMTLLDEYQIEVLIIDDSSSDRTFDKGEEFRQKGGFPFPLTVLANPVNQGYGGNQKIGYHYAKQGDFDFVALLHGDGQYAPECLPELLLPLKTGNADAVFGSRMLTTGSARRGGMPLYKYMGNKILTWFENRMLRTQMSEFHSGYRIYSVAALQRIPYGLNTNDFHFDTEIICQFVFAGLRIQELPIPTYYGDEICRVNGIKYAWQVAIATLKARAQQMGVFYDHRYDCANPTASNNHYQMKLDYQSPHSKVIDLIAPGARVLDLGCAGGYVGNLLRQSGCTVTGVDMFPLSDGIQLDAFINHDLNLGPPDLDFSNFDYVLMLDVIEHLSVPEKFVEKLRDRLKHAPNVKLFVSSGNIAFVITRFMLLLGQFNYGKRGILDITHTRLFTFSSLKQLFEQSGFRVSSIVGIPAPFPLVLGSGAASRSLLWINQLLIKVSRGMFSYQSFLEINPQPSLDYLLACAIRERDSRLQEQPTADLGEDINSSEGC